MKHFRRPTFIALLFILLLVRPLAIHMQFNNYNGYYPGNYAPNGYYPYYYGNGNGFCYVNMPYCCYNYIPPNFLYLLGPLISQILRSLTLPNLGSLFNSLQTASPLAPGFINGLQTTNPPIFNAYNQLYNAYTGLDPATQQMLQQFSAAMLPAFQNAINTFNSQPTPQFDQNFPQLANFLRSQGMRQLAQDPYPFGPAQTQSNQLPAQQPNNPPAQPAAAPNFAPIGQPPAAPNSAPIGQPPAASNSAPIGQPPAASNSAPIGQPPAASNSAPIGQSSASLPQQSAAGAGGGPGLVDGILGAVGSVASAASSALGRK